MLQTQKRDGIKSKAENTVDENYSRCIKKKVEVKIKKRSKRNK